MNKRQLFAAWLRLLAILGGGGVLTGINCCGGMRQPARLEGAQLTSPVALSRQGKITVVANTDQPQFGWNIKMKVTKLPLDGGPAVEVAVVEMRDDGRQGDRAKDDAEWYGEYQGKWEPRVIYHVAVELDGCTPSPQIITLPEDIALVSRMPAVQSDADARGQRP